jgi:signal transduction histidine kinase
MLFIAMFFLVFALFVLAWVFRGGQAFWLGLIIFTFGCCIVGLIGMFPRFGNYVLDDVFGLHFTQPDWLWHLLESFSLYELIRFRLWSAVGFVIAVGVFSVSYTSERQKSSTRACKILAYGGMMFFAVFLLWYYDPEHFFQLYKVGANLIANPNDYNYWEKGLQFVDITSLCLIIGIFIYAVWGLNQVFWRSSIFQKKVQALCMGIGILVLSLFFLILFCVGRFSVLNAHTMATTLLPLGPNYPVFDYTFIRAVPFAAIVVMVTVMIAILRFGYLGKWQVNIPNLDQQINLANQAVRLALHSFKNRFLAVQMAMDMASGQLENVRVGEPVEKARIQIQWAKDVCIDALNRLEVLHIQAKRLEVNSRWLFLPELWEEAMRRCATRLEGVSVSCKCLEANIRIWGDREHLGAVLENILQNALDAMAEKQEKGYTPRIWVVMNREYEWSYIRITDNGPGISKENLHKVYRPFFTTKPAKNNWGLGLTYCHRVVKMHGGFINIKSPPGTGTTVEVVLRAAQKI